MNNKVIIIDDSKTILLIVSKELEKTGYEVISAQNGYDAIDKISTEFPDLILLDINLPDIDGFEVARVVKQNPLTKNIPIIFLTGDKNSDDVIKGFDVGAQDYITKPFYQRELLKRVETQIELFNSRREIQRNYENNSMLLDQYKSIVDKSSIVSKTDFNGRITFVNDEFCRISGFTREELIGKTHGVVRHEGMSKNVFKDMWTTIKQKQLWQGEVKNRSKDGSTYVVLSSVMPILNTKNEIVEFMSVRHDITDIYNLRQEIEDTQKEVIYTMGEIGETRSKETGSHVKRVAEYSRLFASLYGLDEVESNLLFTASPMHDIGKVGIADDILKKPGKLTNEEYDIMKTHCEIGHSILKNSNRDVLKAASIVAYEHHEKWDGSGYPRGLSGEDIHIYGRITAVADVFDALGSERCYKEVWEDEKIFKLFKEEKGKHFDPRLIDIFFENFEKFDEIRVKYKD